MVAQIFPPGKRIELGSYHFSTRAIIEFASRYDPQPFHIDEAQAANSLFGGLCASGWHTTAAWSGCFRAHLARLEAEGGAKAGPAAEIGEIVSFEKLHWRMPVFAGQTVRFFCTASQDAAKSGGRPEFVGLMEGFNSADELVIDFIARLQCKHAQN